MNEINMDELDNVSEEFKMRGVRETTPEDLVGIIPSEMEIITEGHGRYTSLDLSFGTPPPIENKYKLEGWLECYAFIKEYQK